MSDNFADAYLEALEDAFVNCEDPDCGALYGEYCNRCNELDAEIVEIRNKINGQREG